MSFAKLDGGIVDSTIWDEPPEVCKVWITMLAKADRDGIVRASLPGLANASRLPRQAVQAALDVFMGPDPDSRTPDHDGRRVAKIEDGWLILNYSKYRLGESKDAVRRRVAKHRQKKTDEPSKDVTRYTPLPDDTSRARASASASASVSASEKPQTRDPSTPTVQPQWARELWSYHQGLNERKKQAVFLSPTTAIQDYLDGQPDGIDAATYAEQVRKLLTHAYGDDCRPWFAGGKETPMWSQCLEPKKFLRRVPEIQASLAAAGPPRRIIAGRNYR